MINSKKSKKKTQTFKIIYYSNKKPMLIILKKKNFAPTPSEGTGTALLQDIKELVHEEQLGDIKCQCVSNTKNKCELPTFT